MQAPRRGVGVGDPVVLVTDQHPVRGGRDRGLGPLELPFHLEGGRDVLSYAVDADHGAVHDDGGRLHGDVDALAG